LSTHAKKPSEKKSDEPTLPTKAEALKLLKDCGVDASVIAHCQTVSALALKIGKRCQEPVNLKLIEVAGLLHDIGRSTTHGIDHAVEGGKIAKSKKLPDEIVRIIERHIGAGLTKEDAERLNLPKKSYLPETLEEKIVAHADNLLSGTKKVPIAQTIAGLIRKHEEEGAKRMLSLHKELGELCGVDLDMI
jgi:uncharacterized protein (TIGR00295 family)